MKSIQTKFIALILGCVLLAFAVTGGVGILNAQQVVDGDSAQIMNLICEKKQGELDALFARIEQSVKTLSLYTQEQLESVERLQNDADYQTAYVNRLESSALNAAESTEGALAVYVRFNPELLSSTAGLFWSRGEQNGAFLEQQPTDITRYDASDTEHVGWYYEPVKNGRATWMTPYMNENLGIEMISYVIPIYRNNVVIGVVGMDIDYNFVEELVESAQIYDSGYAFLTDESGIVMAHPAYPLGTSISSLNVSLEPFVSELGNSNQNQTLFTYKWNGEQKQMTFRALRNGMRLAVTAPLKEIHADRNRLIQLNCIALVIVAALSVLLTVAVTRRLVRPLKELNVAAKKIAEGDLSISISCYTKDEVGMLAESFRKTADHLKQYIGYMNGLAYRDPMTGVKNKTAYQEVEKKLNERMRTEQLEFGVVVLDVNELKKVNDTYGHDFGDMLIVDACKVICKTFQHSPVFRVGGDEFVVVLENDDYANYAQLLKNFEKNVKEYNKTVRKEHQISIARGIAIYGEMDLSFANVFKRADDAMYANKAMSKKELKK